MILLSVKKVEFFLRRVYETVLSRSLKSKARDSLRLLLKISVFKRRTVRDIRRHNIDDAGYGVRSEINARQHIVGTVEE